MVRDSINSTDKRCKSSLPAISGGVIVDLGTGDGRFVYQSALKNPDRFYIGIDASPAALEKISEKIHRKPAKGGLSNVLFVHCSVEDLPSELDGLADEVHVHFPWGSLLGALALGDAPILKRIRRICAADAWLEIIIGIDYERDKAECQRLGLGRLTGEFVQSTLIPRYKEAGFEICEQGSLARRDWPKLCTSWAQRLRGGSGRSLVYLIGRPI